MIGEQVRSYVLHIRIEDDDPLVLGPYTKRRAETLAEALNEQVERGAFTDSRGYIYATAERIDNPQSITGVMAQFGLRRVPA